MKTASDILLSVIGELEDHKEVAKAKTLSEAERKVLEIILREREPYFNNPTPTAKEIAVLQKEAIELNNCINELKKLREEIGL